MSAASERIIREPVPIETAAVQANPQAYFAEVRKKGAVAINEMGIFIVLKHKYMDILLDNENTRQFELEGMYLRGISSGPLFDFYRDAMLFANGDVHKRRRMPMVRTFAYKLMDGMRPRVAEIAAEIIGKNIGRGPMNFLDDFSRAVPARVIAEIIGAPPEDWPRFTKWVAEAARGIGYFEAPELPAIEAGVEALTAYVEELLDARRAAPGEDFLTSYANATAAAGDLSPAEVRVQMAGVILAGSDTTRTGTAAVLSQLLQNPDQWAAKASMRSRPE